MRIQARTQNVLLQSTGTDVSTATICRFLHSQGFSRKKLSIRALQRSDELRAQFQSDISLFEPHMFIFINETGSDKRTALRKFGYSFKGMRAVTDRLLIRGKRFSTIAAMCMDGKQTFSVPQTPQWTELMTVVDF